jgi:kinesin family protein 1
MQWKRRFVDLRAPHLLIHSVPDGDAINAINLTHARIDHDPDFKRLLGATPSEDNRGRGGLGGLTNVFAVYGEQNTFLFAARSESQKIDWILKIDQSYFKGDAENGGGDGDVFEGT